MADLTASTARQVLPAAAAAVTDLVERLPAEPDDALWSRPTPCEDWDVRTLLAHLTAEHLWAPRLLRGETLEDVGDDYDGDVLGSDPVGAWREAVTASLLAWAEVDDENVEIVMTHGPTTRAEYADQMLVDLVVHGWDLARATDLPYDPAPEAVARATAYEQPRVDAGEVSGIFAARVLTTSEDPLDRLVALLGRDSDRSV